MRRAAFDDWRRASLQTIEFCDGKVGWHGPTLASPLASAQSLWRRPEQNLLLKEVSTAYTLASDNKFRDIDGLSAPVVVDRASILLIWYAHLPPLHTHTHTPLHTPSHTHTITHTHTHHHTHRSLVLAAQQVPASHGGKGVAHRGPTDVRRHAVGWQPIHQRGYRVGRSSRLPSHVIS